MTVGLPQVQEFLQLTMAFLLIARQIKAAQANESGIVPSEKKQVRHNQNHAETLNFPD